VADVVNRMSENTWFWIGGYLFIGVVVLIWASRNSDRHPFLSTIPTMLGDPVVTGGLFPVTAILGIALWPVLLIVDLIVPFIRLDACSLSPKNHDDTVVPGTVGVAITTLKPGGKIEIAGERLDATCINDFIPEGSRVRVIRQQGGNRVVERVVQGE